MWLRLSHQGNYIAVTHCSVQQRKGGSAPPQLDAMAIYSGLQPGFDTALDACIVQTEQGIDLLLGTLFHEAVR